MVEPVPDECLGSFSRTCRWPLVLENSGIVLDDGLVRSIPSGSTVRLHGASLPFGFPDDTRLRSVLNDYFSPGTYSIGSLAQIVKFTGGRWAMWDTQGDDNRLFAYIPFQDMRIHRGSSLIIVARGSIVFCSFLCPAVYMVPMDQCQECIVLGLPIKGKK
ncbi:hypothetical protein BJX68DRAFT_232472 [Aspergillus pseudodeflectus]|uniref:Uncharacterized protein n=1 Tax=Aspergillus pseudodeflectus TaxID=176178 RepID=A0ABR4KR32_9EURO